MQNLMIYNRRNLLLVITPSEVLQMLDDITLEDITHVKKKFVIYKWHTIINVTGKI